MDKIINYESYAYSLSVTDVKTGEYTKLQFKVVKNIDEISSIIKNFNNKEGDFTWYNKWCRGWNDGTKKYLEYVMGFIDVKQPYKYV